MPQYDLYPDPTGRGYLLDVQTDLLSGLNTRIVVPLLPEAVAPRPANRLNPVFQIEGAAHVMVTQFLSAVPKTMLGSCRGTLAAETATITAALDMLTHGF